MTYYEILEVTESASEEVIHMAYKALARKFHPDIYKGDLHFAESKMKQINEAYEILSNKDKRKYYDFQLESQRRYTKASQNSSQSTETQSNTKNETSKYRTIYLVIVLVIVFWCVVAYQNACNNAFIAMNNQNFIKAKQLFSDIPYSSQTFKEEIAYVDAGVLMEQGEYVDALTSFRNIKDIPVPISIISSLQSTIYEQAIDEYRSKKYLPAKIKFQTLDGYEYSEDYITLISCSFDHVKADGYYNKLLSLINWEDTNDIILRHQDTAIRFLRGKWKEGYLYFEIRDNDDNTSYYNLPHKYVKGLYTIKDGVFTVEDTQYFRFEILNKDTVSVYCFKDSSTHKMTRQ